MDSSVVKIPGGELAMSYILFPSPTPVFPVLSPLTWSVHKKTIMASRMSKAASGRSVALATTVYPRWAFTLSYGGDSSWLRDQTQNITAYAPLAGRIELEQIIQLHLSCLGSYGEFYFSDPEDNSRSNVPVGVSNGTTRLYNLFFPWGNGPFSPGLNFPVQGLNAIQNVYYNGVPTSPTNYTIDATNTKLDITSPLVPSAGTIITIDFSFYFRCRFLDDHLNTSQWAENLWDVKEVRFESVKP